MVELISQEHFSALKRTVVLPGGLRLAYVEMGDPNGVPVLLLHGFTDSARSWSLAAPYLATGFRVVAPDLRGHGTPTGLRAATRFPRWRMMCSC